MQRVKNMNYNVGLHNRPSGCLRARSANLFYFILNRAIDSKINSVRSRGVRR